MIPLDKVITMGRCKTKDIQADLGMLMHLSAYT